MPSIVHWALVAFVSLAGATTPGRETIRCCPCLSSGLNPADATVTVTVRSPKEIVTIDHTIDKPATTVYVTLTQALASPNIVTQEVTDHPEPPANIETVINASPKAPEPSASKDSTTTVTKTVRPGGDHPETPKTVTVTLKPEQSSAGATTNVAGESKPAETPSLMPSSAVTVTVSPKKSSSQQSALPSRSTAPSIPAESPRPAEPPRPDNGQGVDANTATVAAATQPKVSHTVFATAESNIKTVTIVEKPSTPSVEAVTVAENPANPSTTTATSAGNLSSPSVEIVTSVENLPKFSSGTAVPAEISSNLKPSVETVPVVDNLASSGVDTVTFANSPPNLTASSLRPQPTITAAPQSGTASPSVDHFTTLTHTISSGGNVNIEITIINIFTGETICRKKGSGEPCDSKPKTHRLKPTGEPPCLTTGVVMRTATDFNTVVTVSPGMWSNGTFSTGVSPPLGTGTGRPVLRRGRVPPIRKRL